MTQFLDNLLGAASLAIVDQIEAAANDVLGVGGQAAGALVLIDLRPGMPIGRLAERLRLSHPGAVRLVDRLVGLGWARKEVGDDRRSARLFLTEDGLGKLSGLRDRRADRLRHLTSSLTANEQSVLRLALTKVIQRATEDVVSAFANCRLCDTAACRSVGCPIDALAAKAKAEWSKVYT